MAKVEAKKVDELVYLVLGQLGENLVNYIHIDVSAWLKQWPDAQYYIIATRPEDTHPYIVATTLEDGILTWEVTLADVSLSGTGSAEVRAVTLDGKVKKTRVVRTMVDKSISSPDVGADELQEGYLEKLLAATTAALSGEIIKTETAPGKVSLQGASSHDGQKSETLTHLMLPGDNKFRTLKDETLAEDVNGLTTRLDTAFTPGAVEKFGEAELGSEGRLWMDATYHNDQGYIELHACLPPNAMIQFSEAKVYLGGGVWQTITYTNTKSLGWMQSIRFTPGDSSRMQGNGTYICSISGTITYT